MRPERDGAPGNLFSTVPVPGGGETFQELLRCRNVRIERIVSGANPEPRVYDQEQDEWVCLLQGEAELSVEDERVPLRAGESLFIPAHIPHRVLQTSAEPPCIWLAVHIHPSA